LQQKIGEKVVRRDGSPIKFPEPGSAMHAILVDARGFLGVGSGDAYDYDHTTQGATGLPNFAVRYWDNQPIRGLFEKDNRLRAAELIQSRIHFIVFARERDYRDGELRQVTYACPNPRLFTDGDAARLAYYSFPLRPIR
jgi:hypothetical protein